MPKIDNKKNAIVYLVTNKKNNKKYVGITNGTLVKRWRDHISGAINRGSSTHFARAIRKYGKDNFSTKTLKKGLSYKEAQQLEIFYIDKYDSLKNGYNMAHGGGGTVGFKVRESTKKKLRAVNRTDQWRKKLSESSKGNQKWLGKKHNDKAKKKISDARKKEWKELPEEERARRTKRFADLGKTSFLGKKHSKDTRNKLSEGKWSFPKEKRLEIAKRYKNGEMQKDIAKELGVSRSVITRCVREFSFEKRGKAQTLTDNQIGKMYYQDGLSQNKIAEQGNMSTSTVWYALQRFKGKSK